MPLLYNGVICTVLFVSKYGLGTSRLKLFWSTYRVSSQLFALTLIYINVTCKYLSSSVIVYNQKNQITQNLKGYKILSINLIVL